ncbi:hypothetical protein HDG42_007016 [Paraburkholderia sp. JPY171]|nr:hypothetical protein [Paraburkholderia atlantica]
MDRKYLIVPISSGFLRLRMIAARRAAPRGKCMHVCPAMSSSSAEPPGSVRGESTNSIRPLHTPFGFFGSGAAPAKRLGIEQVDSSWSTVSLKDPRRHPTLNWQKLLTRLGHSYLRIVETTVLLSHRTYRENGPLSVAALRRLRRRLDIAAGWQVSVLSGPANREYESISLGDHQANAQCCVLSNAAPEFCLAHSSRIN